MQEPQIEEQAAVAPLATDVSLSRQRLLSTALASILLTSAAPALADVREACQIGLTGTDDVTKRAVRISRGDDVILDQAGLFQPETEERKKMVQLIRKQYAITGNQIQIITAGRKGQNLPVEKLSETCFLGALEKEAKDRSVTLLVDEEALANGKPYIQFLPGPSVLLKSAEIRDKMFDDINEFATPKYVQEAGKIPAISDTLIVVSKAMYCSDCDFR